MHSRTIIVTTAMSIKQELTSTPMTDFCLCLEFDEPRNS